MATLSKPLLQTTGHETVTDLQIEKQPKHLPWLMLPSCDRDEVSCKSFYNVSNKETLHLKLPEAQNKRCCGSSRGWLAFADKKSTVSLLNPLTRESILLPPIHPDTLSSKILCLLSSCFPCFQSLQARKTENCSIHKVVLSLNPTSAPRDFVAVAIYGTVRRLAFYKPGTKAWTVTEGTRCYYDDVIYHEGEFFAVDRYGRISAYNVVDRKLSVRDIIPPCSFLRERTKHYLVDSHGSLLLITRSVEKDCNCIYCKVKFSILELDLIENELSRVPCFGNQMMFLGQNHSVSLSDGSSQRRWNCIYFTDDSSGDFEDTQILNAHNFGLFHLEDGRTEFMQQRSGDASELTWPAPTWVIFDDSGAYLRRKYPHSDFLW